MTTVLLLLAAVVVGFLVGFWASLATSARNAETVEARACGSIYDQLAAEHGVRP